MVARRRSDLQVFGGGGKGIETTRGRCAPSGRRAAPNPLPVVVPCHRVVRSDGTIGRYAGGADVKRALLALEAAA
jgi:O-6-methylguanine DNA methyltransferase